MKNFRKVFAALMLVCLLCGAVLVVFSSAETAIQNLNVGTISGGYFDFDHIASSDASKFDTNNTATITAEGSKGRIYVPATWPGAHSSKLRSQTVDGRTNKYLNIVYDAGDSYTSSAEAAFCLAPSSLKIDAKDSLQNDFHVLDFDIMADYYIYTADSGETKTTETLDGLTDTEKATAKLSYPEGFYVQQNFDVYNDAGGNKGTGTPKIYIVSKTVTENGESKILWFLRMYSASSTQFGEYQLSNNPGEWNHITVVYKLLNAPTGTKLAYYAYVNGEYACGNETSYSGYNGRTQFYLGETRFTVSKDTINKHMPYSFSLDNIASNAYVDRTTPDGMSHGIADVTNFKQDYAVYNCEDVVYNANYLSPNGNSFALNWVDANGNGIFAEDIAISNTPVINASVLSVGSFGAAKGGYLDLSAWEWNVSEDKTVFTPVSALTMDMVLRVRARGDSSITVRPAIVDVEWVDENGNSLGNEAYFAGSTVEKYTTESNGWYSTEYSAKSNATEGEATDSFIIVHGKDNKFVADADTAALTASIDGIKYNMSLFTNYFMNIYVPEEDIDGVKVLGFFGDAALSNECDGARRVSLNGDIYYQLSFGVANKDVDVTIPKYIGIEATVGGKTQKLSYEVNVNLLSYCNAVLRAYDCNSVEASLVVSLLNYANEAYKLANGTDNASALALIAAHTDCECLVTVDPIEEYKGKINGLTEYLYGASYDVTSAQPAFMLYLLADKKDEVSKIEISYDTIDGEKKVTLLAKNEISVGNTKVIPYSYSAISASDVKEIMMISVYGKDSKLLASGSYSLANYAVDNDVAVANALIAFSKAASAYKVATFGASEAPVIEDIEVSKTSSLRPSTTISLGDKITYKIKVTNKGLTAVTVPVTDTLPVNTYYVSGDASVRGVKLSWNVSLEAGETKELSYVVALDKDSRLLDKNLILTAPAAKAGGNIAECAGENYIARTINAVDAFYMKAGIEAMSYSDENVLVALAPLELQEAGIKSPIAVLRYIYNVAFSKTPDINSRATIEDVITAIFESSATSAGTNYRAEVAPTLWGGSAVTDVLPGIKGESAALELADFIIGDILFVKDSSGARVYVFDGECLISFTHGYESANTNSVITEANSADYYAVLRPTMSMKTLHLSDPDYVNTEELTAQQEALVKTAHQYVLRGTRLQYDDGGIGNSGNSSEYRWQIGKYQPEEYTEQNWKYINCAGFTYDIYLTTLGYDLGGRYTTKALMQHFTNGNAENEEYPFYFQWDADVHADKTRQDEIKNRFLSTLEVGDLVVVTRDGKVGGYGHVMLYVGNGMLAHSTGSSRGSGTNINGDKNTIDNELYEPTIRYMSVESYLFNSTSSNYLFVETSTENTVYQTCIVRPLSKCGNYAIPENTQNRVENLYGIISEKLSSHPEGMTVSKGGEVTFTYKIKNTNDETKILDVTDIVPQNSVLVDAPGAIVDGKNLTWTVTVLPGETVEVAYTVKADGEYGSYIYSAEGKVGGVLHTCPKTYIENTLTTYEQAAILEAIAYYKTNNTDGLMNFALINAIYERAGLAAPFAEGVTAATLKADLFKVSSYSSSLYEFNTASEYYQMVVPTLYGGGKYYTKNYYNSTNKTSSDRSRLPREQSLVFGDIIIAEFSSSSSLYMYTGEGNLVSIGQTSASISYDSRATHNRLQRMLSAGKYYTIIRPSMADSFVEAMSGTHTVSFDTNGGSSIAPVRVANGSALSAPVAPTRANHNFLGWYLNGAEYDFNTPITENITLVAEWESIKDDSDFFNGMQSVLLLGQSNMVGQGDVLTVDPISDDRIFMMRDGRWVKMQEPLHTNSYLCGIGLGASFAKAFVETFDTQLGLIPAAKGATTLEMWAVGGDLYNEAVRRAKIALETSEICAILWHQGEGNQYDTEYAEKLQVILDSMIAELGIDPDKIIIVTGELYGTKGNEVHTPELVALGHNYTNYGIAMSDGLTLMSDKTHFDAPSLRVFGYRYFNTLYNILAGRNYDFVEDPAYYYSEQTPIDEYTWFPFDELTTGSAPAGAVGSGSMGLYLQGGSASILEESATDKYLSVSNAMNSAGTGYTTTFVNSYESFEAGSAIVTEGMFRLGEGSDCDAYLLMVVTEEGTNNGVYKSVVFGADGIIYTVSASGARTAVGTVGTEDWVHVKVILDLKNNLKTVYIDGVAVMENAAISNTLDTSVYAVQSVSLMQFSSKANTTIGTVHVDDYRCYPYV